MSNVVHRSLVTAPVAVIAKICHQAHRAWCQETGDNSQPIWECVSQAIKDSAIAGVQAVIEKPSTTPEESHENWAKGKLAAGWKYGPKKDERSKQHPCLVPYDKLPEHHRQKDFLFTAIVRSFLKVQP